MANITIDGFIVQYTFKWHDKPVYAFSSHEVAADEQTAVVCKHSFDIEIPDDFNPIPQMVAGLEEKKRRARLALAKELADLDKKIGELTAITYDVEAA